MQFSDHQAKPADYRLKFLQYVDQIAPEVKDCLKELCPTYELAKGGYPYLLDQFGHLIMQKRGEPLDDEQYVRSKVNEWYHFVDPEFRSSYDAEVTIKAILDLIVGFQNFIEEFGLNTLWLRKGLLRLLEHFTYEPECYNDLSGAMPTFSWILVRGEPLEFTFEGWSVDESSKQFEANVRRAFDQALADYIATTASSFRGLGYKLTTKGHDLSLVKWLVYWTVKRVSKEQILKLIKKEKPSEMDVQELNKTFRRFETKYDLPYRRSKRGKSMLKKWG